MLGFFLLMNIQVSLKKPPFIMSLSGSECVLYVGAEKVLSLACRNLWGYTTYTRILPLERKHGICHL
jgi:hypothetical protein